jgi:4-diphosphocytidyl-2-C-methyl-D-erythritol kinase
MRVHLTKRIPVGAGLGGGSSDAAAALKAGWSLWKGKPVRQLHRNVPTVLYQCARQLGADVPFFLRGGTACAEGIGEKLTTLKKPAKQWLVLVYPRVHVSTKMAYDLLDKSPVKKILGHRFNSFEPVIFRKYPAIARAKQALTQAGCSDVMMSVSGSAVFGFVRSRRHGQSVLPRLKGRGWDVYLTSFL